MKLPLIMAALLLQAGTLPLLAATLTNETFDGGANGWAGTTSYFTGNWTYSGGEARINFAELTEIVLPDFGLLSSATAATSGSFTGNYDSAGANIIGFTFYAASVEPGGGGNVVLRWGGSTSVFQKAFSAAETGVWYNFSMSLSAAARYDWDLFSGSYDDFDEAIQAVSYVTIRVFRNGGAAQSFSVGDIYLSNQPENRTITFAGSNAVVGAGALLTGKTYDVQTAPCITGAWAYAQSFVATNGLQQITVTNGGERLFWRLLGP